MIKTFASPQDMSDRTGGQITSATHPFLQKELESATEEIRKYCEWHIADIDELTLVQRRPAPVDVWLPAMQIASIVSATVDGATIAGDAIEFDPDTGWTSLRGRIVDITYTAGYATVPADLVTLTLELAAGGLGSPLGITREQAGGVSVTLARASGAITTADHPRLIAYKLGYVS